MFTGIIEKTSKVVGVADGPMFRRLTIAAPWHDVKHGESIAVNGVCLTIAEISSGGLGFDVIAETLAKTNLGMLKAGDEVHLERAMRVGDRIDGHFVQGHVDGVATLEKQANTANEVRLTLRPPDHLVRYVVPKGSIAIDGVSLTVASIDGSTFDVALIPTTLALTTLGQREVGYAFNLEADMFAKTIVSYLERMNPKAIRGGVK